MSISAIAMQSTRLLACILALAVATSGCTTLQPVETSPADAAAQLKAGDTIEVTLRDGSVEELKLVEITEDAYIGESRRIGFDEIASMQVQTIDALMTTLAVVGIIAVIALAAGGGGGGVGGGGSGGGY